VCQSLKLKSRCTFVNSELNFNTSHNDFCLDGNWGSWSSFSSCSKSCGNGGTMSKTRKCNNPQPSRGGKPCIGPDTETVACKTPSCRPGNLLKLKSNISCLCLL